MKLLFGMLLLATTAHAAPATYILTLTNGSQMPLSPFVVYAQNGQRAKAEVGTISTPGFIGLCQNGSTSVRLQELGADMNVTYKAKVEGLMPGETREVEVMVQDPLTQSIQFETMYGKTKDICAVGGIGSHSLYALKQHVTSDVAGKDHVVLTGAFTDPALPMGRTYLDRDVCMNEKDATSCLRSLSDSTRAPGKVRFFSGYLSSVTMMLEQKYGAMETQSLIIPSSGAVAFNLRLKH